MVLRHHKELSEQAPDSTTSSQSKYAMHPTRAEDTVRPATNRIEQERSDLETERRSVLCGGQPIPPAEVGIHTYKARCQARLLPPFRR